MKRLSVLGILLGIVFLGAGCASLQSRSGEGLSTKSSFTVAEIEARVNLDLPNDARIEQVLEIGDSVTVTGYTSVDEQTLLDSLHAQIIAKGYAIPGITASPRKSTREGQPAVVSYAKTVSGERPRFVGISVGLDNGETEFVVTGIVE